MAKTGIPTEGVALISAYPRFIKLLEQPRPHGLPDEVARQLKNVHVPSQMLDGTPTKFQFMAYPLPRPSYETRQKLPIFPEKTITVSGDNWTVSIDLSVFGLINWFYVDGMPELYHALVPYLPMGE